MSLGLSDKEQRERMANSGYNESAISFEEAKVGSMEAYNFSAGASITTVDVDAVSPLINLETQHTHKPSCART